LHRKMKAEDECSALTSKVAGLEQGYKRVACIIALCPLSELADSSLSLNPSCKVSLYSQGKSGLFACSWSLLTAASP
jgi:hypothetical protein